MVRRRKNIHALFLLPLLLFSCADGSSSSAEVQEEVSTLVFPERAKSMNIYEVNIRQYTPEGTINAFAAHLPRLQAMGVDILWVMPVQPIGEKNRKGVLGSYYSIQDYTKVNSNFGTLDDFKALVKNAHNRGMLVILDWVANHTSFDHPWTENEGFHTLDSVGSITQPIGTDWTDVADLNYENEAMRAAMIAEMTWWVTEADIDGFRCDVAGMVPLDFWQAAKDSLDSVKDLFMLAEWDEPMMHEDAFHMSYTWGLHHAMNDVAKGKFNADSAELKIMEDLERYGDNPYRMMFTTNHDENSWNGTVFERFGEGHQAFAAWAFTVRGMPLLYSGQEAGLDKRLRFFDRDTIDFSEVKYQEFYTKLLDLKHKNEALHNGSYGGDLTFLEDNNVHVSSYKRTKGENVVTALINLTGEPQEIQFESVEEEVVDEFSGKKIAIKPGEVISLAPYEYLIDIK